MLLRCPNCGSEERVGPIRGAWFAICQTCGQVLRLVGSVKEQAATRSIECPQCAYAESSVRVPRPGMRITCPQCGHAWTDEG